MKKYLIKAVITFIAIIASDNLYAQNIFKNDSLQRSSISSALHVSDVKAIQIQNTMLLYQNRIDSLLRNKNITPEERHKTIIPLLRERENSIQSLLTLEQYERLKTLVQNFLGQERRAHFDELGKKKVKERMMQKSRSDNN